MFIYLFYKDIIKNYIYKIYLVYIYIDFIYILKVTYLFLSYRNKYVFITNEMNLCSLKKTN